MSISSNMRGIESFSFWQQHVHQRISGFFFKFYFMGINIRKHLKFLLVSFFKRWKET